MVGIPYCVFHTKWRVVCVCVGVGGFRATSIWFTTEGKQNSQGQQVMLVFPSPRTLRIYLELFLANERQETVPSRHEGGSGLTEDKICLSLRSSSGHDPLAKGSRWTWTTLQFQQQVLTGCSAGRSGKGGQFGGRNQDTERKELTLERVQAKGVMDEKPPIFVLERP